MSFHVCNVMQLMTSLTVENNFYLMQHTTSDNNLNTIQIDSFSTSKHKRRCKKLDHMIR